MIKSLIDFRGGVCRTTPELTRDNELYTASNVIWENGLRRRWGTLEFAKDFGSTTYFAGGIRTYIASAWHTVVAVDNGSKVAFYQYNQASATAIALASASYSFTTGVPVEFCDFNGTVVVVNGVNRPAIIHVESATLTCSSLEAYDERDRGTSTWWAGLYWPSGSTVSEEYVNDTTDAQDAGADDWLIGGYATVTASHGFWIACDYTFNKLYLYGVPSQTADIATDYTYYTGSGVWASCNMISSVNWSVATATQVIEFNWPSAWVRGDENLNTTQTSNRFVFRAYFTAAPSSSILIDYATVHNNQYLRQVLDDERPQAVCAHQSRLFMAVGNNIFLSAANTPTDWTLRRAEYFLDGGSEILSMLSFQNYLLAIKESAVHALYGNSMDGWTKRKLVDGVGTIAKRSAASTGDKAYWVGRDNIVWQYDGRTFENVSKHIYPLIKGYTATNSVGFSKDGNYWLSFPSESITIVTDPDSYRTDDTGDGRISWYFFNYPAWQFVYYNGAGDTGYFYGLINDMASVTGPRLVNLQSGVVDSWMGTTQAVTATIQTKFGFWGGEPGSEYRGSRVKFHMMEASTTANYWSTYLVDENHATVASITITVSTGTGAIFPYFTLPYTVDGKYFSIQMSNSSSCSAALYQIAFELNKRRF